MPEPQAKLEVIQRSKRAMSQAVADLELVLTRMEQQIMRESANGRVA